MYLRFTEIYQILQVLLLKIVIFDFISLCDLFVISKEAYEISEVLDPLQFIDHHFTWMWLLYIDNVWVISSIIQLYQEWITFILDLFVFSNCGLKSYASILSPTQNKSCS